MSAVADLTAGVAALTVSVDAAVALIEKKSAPPAEDPAVAQAVTDIAAQKAKLDAEVAKG